MSDELKIIEISVVGDAEQGAIHSPSFGNSWAKNATPALTHRPRTSAYGPFKGIQVYGDVVVFMGGQWGGEQVGMAKVPFGGTYVIRDATPNEELYKRIGEFSEEQFEQLHNLISTMS